MDSERLEAIGQKGEACIIIVKTVTLPNGQSEQAYSLATGERLKPGSAGDAFVTTDGRRSFRLRQPATRSVGGSETA